VLPFLKNKDKSVAGLIIKTRKPDEKPEQDQQDDPSAAIKACANALIQAVHMRDEQGVADAISDAFQILDAMPHEEGEHKPAPHSYEAQNIKAGSQD
jgi:hypothetical protein